PFTVKMPELKKFTALTLNRELCEFEAWDESAIRRRAAALFEWASKIWSAPQRSQTISRNFEGESTQTLGTNSLPPNGSLCRFTYAGIEYTGTVIDQAIVIQGIAGRHGTFSAASKAVSGTIRNGWKDWYIQEPGRSWMLADDWRRLSM